MKLLAIFELILLSTVSSHKACFKNTNLWKSIQYQLKLAENTDGRCDCETSEFGRQKMVGFLAKSSRHQSNINAGSTVVFDRIVTNTGSGYDASTGQFIAPYEGLYYFTWTTLTAPLKYFITDIRHNGNKVAGNQSDGRGLSNAHMSSTQSVVLQLAAKDKVYIVTQWKGQFMNGHEWSSFSGFKI